MSEHTIVWVIEWWWGVLKASRDPKLLKAVDEQHQIAGRAALERIWGAHFEARRQRLVNALNERFGEEATGQALHKRGPDGIILGNNPQALLDLERRLFPQE